MGQKRDHGSTERNKSDVQTKRCHCKGKPMESYLIHVAIKMSKTVLTHRLTYQVISLINSKIIKNNRMDTRCRNIDLPDNLRAASF